MKYPRHSDNKPGSITQLSKIYVSELNWYDHDFETPVGKPFFQGYLMYDVLEINTHTLLGGIFWDKDRGEYIFIQEVRIEWTSELLENIKVFIDGKNNNHD